MADGYFVELFYNQDAKHLVGRTDVFGADDLDRL